jgi:hypothetical protein
MTESDLRLLNGAIKIAWPGQGWPDLTVKGVAGWFVDIDLAVAREALSVVFKAGHEFPPQPSTLLSRARALQEATRLYLPPPDSCRMPDAEELARQARWRLRLRDAADRHLVRSSTDCAQTVHSPEEVRP